MADSTEIRTKEEFVYVANGLLNKDTSNEDREKADKLLSQLYKSPQAWPICREVLADHTQIESIIFTAAKLLRVKMFYYFNELPEAHYADFFTFIISTVC